MGICGSFVYFTEISMDMLASFNLSEDACSQTINELVSCEQHGEISIELESLRQAVDCV